MPPSAQSVPVPAAARSPAATPPFDAVYREHVQAVARWTARLGGHDIDVEDTVQEIFLTVSRRLAEFRGEAQVASWIYAITRKTVANQLRRQRWRRWLAGPRILRAAAASAASASPGPEAELVHRQACERFDRILRELPEKYRSVLVLFELEDLSTKQIAELCALKPATVKVQLHRARAMFMARQRDLEERGRR